MDEQLSLKYDKILSDYLRAGQEIYLYKVAQFGKELMKQRIGPEAIVEIHLKSVKKVSKDKRIYLKKFIDKSFTFLMEGIVDYDIAYKEYTNSKTVSYLAKIKELNRRLSRKLAEMNALYETAKATGSSLDMNEVLSLVFKNAVKTLKAKSGSLMLFDPDEKTLTIKKSHGLDKDIIRRSRIKMGEGIAGLVAKNGKPMVIHRKSDSPQIKGRKKYGEIKSICVPLRTQKGVIGIINLNCKESSELFAEDDLKLIFTMAHEAASAIENTTLYKDLHESYIITIRALVSALELKDPYTKGHSNAVARYAKALAKRLSISPQEIEAIEVAAILHDIGKIGIRESVLNKPGKLDDGERREMKRHPEFSCKILDNSNFPWDIKPIIYAHHERYDGKGYPSGLKGEEIPLGARIIAVADSHDAMTSDRVYRKGFSRKTVIKELKIAAGTQFDPKIVEVFTEMLKQ